MPARVVRISGTAFEAVSALVHRRERGALYHSALVVTVPEGRFVIEQAPVPDLHGERGGRPGDPRDASGSSATRSAAGATDGSPTSTPRSGAR